MSIILLRIMGDSSVTEQRVNCKQVQATNDFSIRSKLSTVLAGYADDSCLAEIVVPSSGSGRKLRRSPLIHRGYYIRHRAMRTVFDWLYDLSEQLNHSPIQVVSLGAGYDTAYFHHTLSGRLSRNVLFIELDYDRVVEEKRRLILRSTKLTSAFDSPDTQR